MVLRVGPMELGVAPLERPEGRQVVRRHDHHDRAQRRDEQEPGAPQRQDGEEREDRRDQPGRGAARHHEPGGQPRDRRAPARRLGPQKSPESHRQPQLLPGRAPTAPGSRRPRSASPPRR